MATTDTEATQAPAAKPATRAKTASAPNIYQIISTISAEAGALTATQSSGVPFPFRGIDGTINHLSPHLQKHGVIVVPEVLEHEVTPREVGQRVVKTAKILTRFTFYAPDGTSVSATTAGLADDFADRATAQAQSVAFRVALLQTFTLPTQSPEPEQTGQVVQDAKHEPKTAAGRKVEAARAPAAAAKPPQSREKVKADFIDTEKFPRDAVNALKAQVISEHDLANEALYALMHKVLSSGTADLAEYEAKQ